MAGNWDFTRKALPILSPEPNDSLSTQFALQLSWGAPCDVAVRWALSQRSGWVGLRNITVLLHWIDVLRRRVATNYDGSFLLFKAQQGLISSSIFDTYARQLPKESSAYGCLALLQLLATESGEWRVKKYWWVEARRIAVGEYVGVVMDLAAPFSIRLVEIQSKGAILHTADTS